MRAPPSSTFRIRWVTPVSYTHLVSLFGLADYTWNINGFKSEESWKEGVKRLFPQAAEAMQVFVNHNSDRGPNGHGYRLSLIHIWRSP